MTVPTPKPGWPRVRFGDVVKLNKDRSADPAADGIERYVGIEHIEPEDLRIRSWGLVAEGTTFTQRIRPGQTLFVKRRAYQRKVAIAEFDAVCSGDIYVLEPKDDRLLPELLPFLCQTDDFFEHAVNTSAGSLSPRTNWTQLAQYKFALPPLAEQRRMARVLEQTETLLEELKTLLDQTTVVANALVEAMISPLMLNTQVELGTLAEVRYGLTVNETRRNAPDRIPYLCVANVMRGRLDIDEVKHIGQIVGDEVYELQYEDVLIVEGHANSMEVGRAVIWKMEIDRCSHQNHLIRARCGDALDPEFLTVYLNSTFGRKYFIKHAKSTSGLNTINSSVVQKIPVPVVDASYQKHLVTWVNDIHSQHKATHTRLEQLKLVKKMLLREFDYAG